MSIYTTDKKYKWGALFILVFAIGWIILAPHHWPFVAGYLVLVALIAYFKRNSP